ncbi:MAG: hypothetical protein RLY21_702 [Planctomycetota bacterium]|jgi:hypothetical protein
MNLTLTLGCRSLCAATLAAVVAGVASAQVVDINGGSSWSGWTSIADSQTSGVWVRGQTDRTFNIFRTQFTLNAGQSVGGTRLADGNAGNGIDYTGDSGASLFSGSWQAGDRVIGVGIQYTGSTRGTTAYLHVDVFGNNILPASSFGANDGVFSHDVGDTSSYITSMPWNPGRFQTKQYSIWSGFSSEGSPGEGNYSFPYGQNPTLAMPTRSFAVLDSGSQLRALSLQMFINLDAILRSNGGATYGDGNFFADGTRIGFFEGDQTVSEQASTNQMFAIPAPGAIALLGLAGVAGKRRRR